MELSFRAFSSSLLDSYVGVEKQGFIWCVCVCGGGMFLGHELLKAGKACPQRREIKEANQEKWKWEHLTF